MIDTATDCTHIVSYKLIKINGNWPYKRPGEIAMTTSYVTNEIAIKLHKSKSADGGFLLMIKPLAKMGTTIKLACSEPEAIEHFAQAVVDYNRGKIDNWL